MNCDESLKFGRDPPNQWVNSARTSAATTRIMALEPQWSAAAIVQKSPMGLLNRFGAVLEPTLKGLMPELRADRRRGSRFGASC